MTTTARPDHVLLGGDLPVSRIAIDRLGTR